MDKYRTIVTMIGKRTVYLLNTFEDVVIKIYTTGEYWYVKPKGGQEYRIHHSATLARETLLEANEITEEEYNKY